MEQYKTVKEVCAFTGLTGKHYVDEGTECLSALSGPRSPGAHHSVRCFFFCLMRTCAPLTYSLQMPHFISNNTCKTAIPVL